MYVHIQFTKMMLVGHHVGLVNYLLTGRGVAHFTSFTKVSGWQTSLTYVYHNSVGRAVPPKHCVYVSSLMQSPPTRKPLVKPMVYSAAHQSQNTTSGPRLVGILS